MKNKLILFGFLTIFGNIILSISQTYAEEPIPTASTTEVVNIIPASEFSEKLSAREVLPQSAFVLPKEGNRISLGTYYRGLGHKVEFGTGFLMDVIGLPNIDISYNFLNINSLAFKASTFGGYALGKTMGKRKYWLSPKLTLSFLELPTLHTHISTFYSNMAQAGAGYSSYVGFVRNIEPANFLGFNITSEYRFTKNDRYENSFLLGVGRIIHLDGRKSTLNASAEYVWVWNKLHAGIGIAYSSSYKLPLFKHFFPTGTLYWTF